MYVDALVLRDRDTDGNGSLDERLYALQDANWNTTALINSSGTTQERYTPFGQVTFRDGSGSTLSASAKDWVFLHQGGERIAAGDYEFRNRIYSPSLGRWLSNDPLGFEAGDQNWYRAIGNNPVNGNDPSGLDWLLGGLFWQNTNHLPYRPDPFKPSKNPQKKPEGPRNPNEIQSGELDQYSQIAGITWKSNTDWYSAVGEQVNPHMAMVGTTIAGYLIPGTLDEYLRNYLALRNMRIVGNKIIDRAGKAIPEDKIPGLIRDFEHELGIVGQVPKAPIPKKVPLPRIKGEGKVADIVPENVPKNWTKPQISDAISTYELSIKIRRAEAKAFDAAGGGHIWIRKAHYERIKEEEVFMRQLKKALEEMP